MLVAILQTLTLQVQMSAALLADETTKSTAIRQSKQGPIIMQLTITLPRGYGIPKFNVGQRTICNSQFAIRN